MKRVELKNEIKRLKELEKSHQGLQREPRQVQTQLKTKSNALER